MPVYKLHRYTVEVFDLIKRGRKSLETVFFLKRQHIKWRTIQNPPKHHILQSTVLYKTEETYYCYNSVQSAQVCFLQSVNPPLYTQRSEESLIILTKEYI